MDEFAALVAQLEVRGDTPEKQQAMRALYAAGEQAKPALLAGLDHRAWRVRHGCLRVLDHAVVDDETRVRVVRALDDPHRKVRRAAIHLLGCEICKPEGFCGIEGVDIDGAHLEAAASDPSRRVRKAAIGHFMWSGRLDPRVEAVMRRIVAEDRDEVVRRSAAHVLLYPEARTGEGTANERYQRLVARIDALVASPAEIP